MTLDKAEIREQELDTIFDRRIKATAEVIRSYKEVYATESGKVVFRDLMIFSNFYGSSYHPDINTSLRLEGRGGGMWLYFFFTG